MVNHKFEAGEVVCFQHSNEDCCGRVMSLRTKDNQPTYLVREMCSGKLLQDMSEDSLMICECNEIVNKQWDKFVYNGNNMEATTWIMTNILRHIKCASNVQIKHTDTVFTLKIGDDEWNKQKTE